MEMVMSNEAVAVLSLGSAVYTPLDCTQSVAFFDLTPFP
jgi:hypothetical protein